MPSYTTETNSYVSDYSVTESNGNGFLELSMTGTGGPRLCYSIGDGSAIDGLEATFVVESFTRPTGWWGVGVVAIEETSEDHYFIGTHQRSSGTTLYGHYLAYNWETNSTSGWSSLYETWSDQTAPYWVRVVVYGGYIYLYQGSDGQTWTLVESGTCTSSIEHFGLCLHTLGSVSEGTATVEISNLTWGTTHSGTLDGVWKPPFGSVLNRRHPLANGLVGCYPLNERSGTTVYDLSGNNYHGTITGGAEWSSAICGPTVYNDDTNGKYIDLPHSELIDLPLGEFSFVALSVPTVAQEYNTLVGWGGTDDIIFSDNSYGAASGSLGAKLFWRDLGGVIITGSHDYTDLAGLYVFTSDNTARRIYRNGFLVGEDTGSLSGVGPFSNVRLLDWSDSAYTYGGHIALALFYDRVLSSDELRLLQTDPYGMFRPQRAWVLSEGSTATNLDVAADDSLYVSDDPALSLSDTAVSVYDGASVAEDISLSIETSPVYIECYDEVSLSEDVAGYVLVTAFAYDEITLTEDVVPYADLNAVTSDTAALSEDILLSFASSVSVSDAVSLSEEIVLAYSDGVISLYDEVTTAEAVVGSVEIAGISAYDDVTVSEDVAGVGGAVSIIVNDVASLADVVSVSALALASVVYETVSVGESVGGVVPALILNVFDSIHISETVNDASATTINVADEVTVAEAIDQSFDLLIHPYDTVVITELVVTAPSDIYFKVGDDVVITEDVDLFWNIATGSLRHIVSSLTAYAETSCYTGSCDIDCLMGYVEVSCAG